MRVLASRASRRGRDGSRASSAPRRRLVPTARRRASHDVALAAPARGDARAETALVDACAHAGDGARARTRRVRGRRRRGSVGGDERVHGGGAHRAVAARADAGTEGARDLVVTHRGALVEATSESVVEGLEDGGAVLVGRGERGRRRRATTRRRRAVARDTAARMRRKRTTPISSSCPRARGR